MTFTFEQATETLRTIAQIADVGFNLVWSHMDDVEKWQFMRRESDCWRREQAEFDRQTLDDDLPYR